MGQPVGVSPCCSGDKPSITLLASAGLLLGPQPQLSGLHLPLAQSPPPTSQKESDPQSLPEDRASSPRLIFHHLQQLRHYVDAGAWSWRWDHNLWVGPQRLPAKSKRGNHFVGTQLPTGAALCLSFGFSWAMKNPYAQCLYVSSLQQVPADSLLWVHASRGRIYRIYGID